MPSKPPDKGGTETTKSNDTASQKVEPHKPTVIIEIPRWLFFSTSVLVGFISVMIGSYVAYVKMIPREPNTDILHNVGIEGVQLFELHDRDGDGYLSIEEFEPFIYRLLESNVSIATKLFLS